MAEKTLIIIPAYNEEENIGALITEIVSVLPEVDILVINDGSKDTTSQKARANKEVKVIDLPINLGVGGAVQTGFIYALQHDYNFAVKLDGDLQHPPNYVPEMLKELRDNCCDIVSGARFSMFQTDSTSLYRKVGIGILRFWTYLLTGLSIKDPTSGFRAYNRKAVEFMAVHYPSFDYPEPEEIVLANKNLIKIKEIPVEMRTRSRGISSISSTGSLYFMAKVCLAMLFIAVRSED